MRPVPVLLLSLLWMACSGTPPEIRSLPIVSISDTTPDAGGEILFPSRSMSTSKLTVRLTGLAPERSYILCLNTGEPNTPTSETLGKLQLHGWPLGSFYDNPQGFKEGHWNFVRIESDASGRFERGFELPLPPLDYRIRLLIKTAGEGGYAPVAQSDAFLMAVSGSPLKRWLAGTMFALAFVPLLFIVRGRARDRGEHGAPDHEAAEAAGADVNRTPSSSEDDSATGGGATLQLNPAAPGLPDALGAEHTRLDASEVQGSEFEDPNQFNGHAFNGNPCNANQGDASQGDPHRCDASHTAMEPTNGSAGPSSLIDRDLTLVERARIEGNLRHGKRFSWIEIHNRRKHFRARQALVFQILCEQDPNCDGLPQEEIIREWEAVYEAKRANPVRVRDIFRACADEPGDFIVRVPGPASVYRLGLLPTTSEKSEESEESIHEDSPAELKDASQCESSSMDRSQYE